MSRSRAWQLLAALTNRLWYRIWTVFRFVDMSMKRN